MYANSYGHQASTKLKGNDNWWFRRKSFLACYQQNAKNHNQNIKNAAISRSGIQCLTSNARVLAVSVKNSMAVKLVLYQT